LDLKLWGDRRKKVRRGRGKSHKNILPSMKVTKPNSEVQERSTEKGGQPKKEFEGGGGNRPKGKKRNPRPANRKRPPPT